MITSISSADATAAQHLYRVNKILILGNLIYTEELNNKQAKARIYSYYRSIWKRHEMQLTKAEQRTIFLSTSPVG